ncbi:MAG: hypothetical protein QXO70_02130 [Candidatus Pacearchaeota archaeon]
MPKKIIFDFPKVELSIPENCNFANLAELNPEYVSFTDAGSGAGISSITIIKNVSLKDLENVFYNCRQVEPYGFFESVNAYNKLLKDGEFSVKTKTDSATKSLNIEINQTDGNIIIQASVRYDNPMPH